MLPANGAPNEGVLRLTFERSDRLTRRATPVGTSGVVRYRVALSSNCHPAFGARSTPKANSAPDDVESVGTRHRAAYRFINTEPGGLAIVVSHDGGVSFVANREKEVVIWEQSMSP
jgi:hypothetical protein